MELGAEQCVDGGRTSRRQALKLGVGAGVGAVAWSGASITSLGGTPAYAQGCTFAIQITVAECRNTSQANCGGDGSTIAYLPFDLEGEIAPGIFLDDDMTNSFRCNGSDSPSPTLTFPNGIECEIIVNIARPPNCTGTNVGMFTSGISAMSPIVYQLPTAAQTGPLPSNAQYEILVQCQTVGATGCF